MKKILLLLIVLGGTIAANAQCNAKVTCSNGKHAQCSKTLDKNSEEYKLCYERLKELEIKKMESASHNKSMSMSRAFDKKLNQKIDISLYSDEYAFNQWIEKNIHTTNFGTVADAKAQWHKINDAYKAAVADNKEYYDYKTELALSVENASEIIAGANSAIAYENVYSQK